MNGGMNGRMKGRWSALAVVTAAWFGCGSVRSTATAPATPVVAEGPRGVQTGAATPTTSPAGSPPKVGILLMAHGGPPEWNQAVLDAVQPLRKTRDLEVAFGMADADSIQEGVRKLEARNVRKIGVVRLFVSGESFLERTEQVLALRAGAPPAPPAGHGEHAMHGHVPASTAGHAHHAAHAHHAVHAAANAGHAEQAGHSMAFYRVASRSSFALSSDGLVDAEGMGTILTERAAALSRNPAKEDVLILAHGPGDDGENERWLSKLDTRASVVRARLPFRRVQVETLREDWPDKRKLSEQRIRAFVQRASKEGGQVIVLPFRVQGFGPYAEVLKGLPYVSDGKGLIPHTEVTKWIEQQAAAVEAGPFRPTIAP